MMNGSRWRATRVALILCAAAGAAAAQTVATPPPQVATPAQPAPDGLAAAQPPASARTPAAEKVGDVITLRDVAVDVGVASLRASRVEIVGSDASAQDAAALFTARTPQELRARLATFSAKRIEAPELAVEIAAGALRYATTYRDVRIEGVAKGRMERVGATSAAVLLKTPDDEQTGEMTGLWSRGVNLDATLRLAAEGGDPKEGPQTLYEGFGVERYAFRSREAGEGEFVDMTGGPARMTPTQKPLIQIVRTAMDLASASKTEAGKDAAMRAALPDFRAFVEGLEFDGGRAALVTAKPPGDKGEIRLEGLSVRDMRRGSVTFALDAMKFDGPDAQTTLRGLEFRDYRQIWIFDILEKMASDPAGENSVNPIAFVPPFAKIGLESFYSCQPRRASCAAQDANFLLDGFAIVREPVADGLDTRFDLKRLRLSGAADLPEMDVAAAARIEYRREARTLALRELSASGVGWGRATAALSIENVLPQIFEEERTAAMIALTPLALTQARLRLVDEGGVDKSAAAMWAQQAERDAKASQDAKPAKNGAKSAPPKAKTPTSAEARAALADQIARDLSPAASTPAVKALMDALTGFVRDPAAPLALTATAKPSISGLDIVSGGDALALLRRVTISSERR